MENKKTYALITGASGGIGLEFARIAARQQFNLVLIARSEQKLVQLKGEIEKNYGVNVCILSCDLSKEEAIEEITGFLTRREITVDILINNAGFGVYGAFKETDLEKEISMLHVNIGMLTALTKVIYRQMRDRKRGKILNVASVAGFFPGPYMAVYYASKAYVLSFSRALANEAKGSGVSITVLCPGPTLSGFEDQTGLASSMLFKSFGKLPSAGEVAAYGFKKMQQRKECVIYGWKNKCMVYAGRFIPGRILSAVVRYIQRPVKE